MGPLAEAAAESQAESRPAAAPGPSPAPDLRPFGSELFERATSQFQPLLTGPVDPDYRLGPGDQFVLILTGDVELTHGLDVTREGFVVIPQVGQIWVNGLTLAQLTDVLYTRLGRVYSGVRRGQGATTRFQVSISRLRMNQVFVIGEVNRPGAYQVPSVGTLFYALYLAGGPNANGSYRGIALRRGGRVLRTMDIYDYLLRGDNTNDVRLESGDIIFVPVQNRQVGIQGNIVRPALYELRPADNLFDLLRYAGGVTPPAFLRRARIERVLPPAERVAPDLDRVFIDVDLAGALADSAAAPALRAGDDVAVFAIRDEVRNVVTIAGAVWRGASYEYRQGMHLWDLVRLAEGLRVHAYLTRAHIVRLNPVDGTVSIIPVALDTLPDGSPAENPELQEFDGVRVFARTAFEPTHGIEVNGSVRNPGAQPRFEGMTLRDAVLRAGGLDRDTYTGRAFISRRQPDLTRRLIPITLTVDSLLIPLNADTLEDFDIVEVLGLQQFANSFPVAITGEVRGAISGTYQEGMTLRDLVIRAGGLTPAADLTIEIARLAPQERRVGGRLVDLVRVRVDSSFVVPDEAARFYLGSPDSLDSRFARSGDGAMPLRPYDHVFVRRLPDVEYPRTLVLVGEFTYPGQYSIERRDERLRDLVVTRAGGVKPTADPAGMRFYRSGTLVNVDFPGVLRSRRHRDNLVLQPGDSIVLPEYNPIVLVQGAVNSPSAVLYRSGAGLDYYIANAGGYSRNADKGHVSVRYANGSGGARRKVALFFTDSPTPGPGSIVSVPLVPEGEEKTDWAGIVSSIATVLTSTLTIVLVVQRL
jgi:protein involved in polysaccharide export with SLBB domain